MQRCNNIYTTKLRPVYHCLLNSENREADKINRTPHKLDSQRRIKELIDSGDFTEEDEKGIDVPFFSLESILAATDDFSDLNNLGQGGYGPVYKVIFFFSIFVGDQ